MPRKKRSRTIAAIAKRSRLKLLEDVVYRHLEARGAKHWTVAMFCSLASTLGCSPRVLAIACGVTHRSDPIGKWRDSGMVPEPVALHCAIIKQFVDFKLTGELSAPIIPLDAVMGGARRISKLKKFRRRELRRRGKRNRNLKTKAES